MRALNPKLPRYPRTKTLAWLMDSTLSAHGNNPPRHEASPLELPASGAADLNDDQIAALGTGLVEASRKKYRKSCKLRYNGGAILKKKRKKSRKSKK